MQRLKMHLAAIRQQAIDSLYIVHHIAVANRSRTAAIIAGHSPQSCTIGCGDIDRIEQPVGFKETVKMIQHHARLHTGGAGLGIKFQKPIEILRGIHDQRLTDCLTGL